MVARGTVNWIITLCFVGVVVAKATLRHAISIAWLRRRVVRCPCRRHGFLLHDLDG
jgi:hypothetical protein